MADLVPPFALGSFSKSGEEPFLGIVLEDQVTPVSTFGRSEFTKRTTLNDLLGDWPSSIANLKSIVASGFSADTSVPIGSLTAHSPLPEARQVFCTGANYRKHLVEMVVAVGGPEVEGMNAEERRAFAETYVDRQVAESRPFVFMKPVSAIAGPCDDLILPEFSECIDWEIELGVVIGAQTHRTSRDNAMDAVAGYMVVNDVTARDKIERTDPGGIARDWLAGKGAPGFLPTGPLFVPAEFIPDPYELEMKLSVNGQIMQHELPKDMTFNIARQIEHITEYARMFPGDILCTGSPAGNGISRNLFLKDGDVMEAEITCLGKQLVRCVRK